MKRLLLVFVLCVAAVTVALIGHQSPPGVASSPTLPSEPWPGASRSASQMPTVWVDPPSSTVQAGEVFTVTVMIADASDLAAFEFDLVYTPSVVEVVTMTLGSFLSSTGRNTMQAGPLIDNTSGRTIYAGFSWGHEPGVNGQGAPAHVRLRALAGGTSPLTLEDVQLTDPRATVLSAASQDGSVTVEGPLSWLYLPLLAKGLSPKSAEAAPMPPETGRGSLAHYVLDRH